ncbi:hypothetical protein [Aquabacter sediminis]|uniref:hypothetical protein n=1 Tax=Aquabacter sediminis TaxID=3029197 RepID=UPI00237DC62D|nr:hypothetical protein [Aquabacter sp. P-9]MDE1568055.1 hypothetical protein [Aquabacter sp. P-9]
MKDGLLAADAAATARTAGLDLTEATALRIATALTPAFKGFSVIAGTLPLDLEPATFQLVQDTARAEDGK